LQASRDFNDELPPDGRVRVHLVDLNYTPAAVHAHLLDLQNRLGEAAEQVDIPAVEEFQQWDEYEMASLAERLASVAEAEEPSPRILQEFATAQDSIGHWIAWVEQFGEERPREPPPDTVAMVIREERITENIRHLLSDLEGKPVLALFGAGHAQKQGQY